jgi:hypothetical protein
MYMRAPTWPETALEESDDRAELAKADFEALDGSRPPPRSHPAVTLAHAATDTPAGIRPADARGFIAAPLLGAAATRWLTPGLPVAAPRVVASRASREAS